MNPRLTILDRAYQIGSENPRPFYCATGCRFGTCSRRCFDCSGYTWTCYRAAGIFIGLDTGAIGRDASRGRARFLPLSSAVGADLVMRRNGPVYNGGPDEHVGIFVRVDGPYIWSWESAGRNGVNLYRRPPGFWRDVVRYPQLSQDAPPVEPQPEDTEMTFLFRDERDGAIYLKDTSRPGAMKVPTPAVVGEYQRVLKGEGGSGQVYNLSGLAADTLLRQ